LSYNQFVKNLTVTTYPFHYTYNKQYTNVWFKSNHSRH